MVGPFRCQVSSPRHLTVNEGPGRKAMNQATQSRDKRKGTARLPKLIRDAIAAIVAHYWNDEFQHYVSTPRNERKLKPHVFEDIRLVSRWLDRGDEAND